jgi:hypothetical protein
MRLVRTNLFLGLLAFAGCASNRNAALFHPWGWEDAKDAYAHLDSYEHVIVARIDECSWEDRGPHRLTPYHFKATVIRSYKGNWRVSERISFVHYVDSPAPTTLATNRPGGELVLWARVQKGNRCRIKRGRFKANRIRGHLAKRAGVSLGW